MRNYARASLCPHPAVPIPKARPASFLAIYYTTSQPNGSRDTECFCGPLSDATACLPPRLTPCSATILGDQKCHPLAAKKLGFSLACPYRRLKEGEKTRLRSAPKWSFFAVLSSCKLENSPSGPSGTAPPIPLSKHLWLGYIAKIALVLPEARSAMLSITAL